MARHLENENRGDIIKISGLTKEEILKVKTPEKTDSYTPVPYSLILSTIEKESKKMGMDILKEDFRTSNGGNKLVGIYQLVNNQEDAIDPSSPDRITNTIAFRTSHDKSMAFGVFSGASVLVCTNGMYAGNISYLKKHIKDVDIELQEQIKIQLDSMSSVYRKMLFFKENLKEIEISKRVTAEILGRLIFEQKVLRSTQINLIKEQMRFSKYFNGNSAWDLYNNVTESLKLSAPIQYHNNHVATYHLFNDIFIKQSN